MAIDSKHPDYADMLPDWETMVDTNAGERRIKEKGTLYLSPTAGMNADGMRLNQPGYNAYLAYKHRARFPDVVGEAVKALLGIMHSKPSKIELPPAMEKLRKHATNLGEPLEVLLQRINEAQMITGRIGLLLDVPTGATVGTLPYIATYEAQSILNWDDGSFNDDLVNKNLNLVVLDESGMARDKELEWVFTNKYRALVLGDLSDNEGAETGALYRVGVFTKETASLQDTSAMIAPSLGGKTLDFIPFTFINASDVVAKPDKPPQLGLAANALGIYRGEADYRQALFMQGQDTLVLIGSSDPEMSIRTGAGASIMIPMGGDAKFIGVDSTGLSEMRQGIENDKAEAAARSGNMIDTASRTKESGDALRIRVVGRTATLTQLAKTGAFGLQQSLRQIARWIGANPEQVIVEPNLDFVNDTLGGKELVEMATAKAMGAPISNVSIHKQMEDKGMTEMTLEEELAEIDKEEPFEAATFGGGLPDEEDPEGDTKPESVEPKKEDE